MRQKRRPFKVWERGSIDEYYNICVNDASSQTEHHDNGVICIPDSIALCDAVAMEAVCVIHHDLLDKCTSIEQNLVNSQLDCCRGDTCVNLVSNRLHSVDTDASFRDMCQSRLGISETEHDDDQPQLGQTTSAADDAFETCSRHAYLEFLSKWKSRVDAIRHEIQIAIESTPQWDWHHDDQTHHTACPQWRLPQCQHQDRQQQQWQPKQHPQPPCSDDQHFSLGPQWQQPPGQHQNHQQQHSLELLRNCKWLQWATRAAACARVLPWLALLSMILSMTTRLDVISIASSRASKGSCILWKRIVPMTRTTIRNA